MVAEGVLKVEMVRPRVRRRVRGRPGSFYFKPAGKRMVDLSEVVLILSEFEAIRLVDLRNVSQELAGERMGISQSTLSRVLKNGRRKIADAIVSGKAIRIEK